MSLSTQRDSFDRRVGPYFRRTKSDVHTRDMEAMGHPRARDERLFYESVTTNRRRQQSVIDNVAKNCFARADHKRAMVGWMQIGKRSW